MTRSITTTLALISTVAVASHAAAGFTWSQQAAPAPTYSNLITFDEPGAPTGLVASNHWAGLGLASFTDGANPGVLVGDVGGSFPWINTGNVADGFAFGLYMTWDSEIAALSFQMWSSAGPSSPFGAVSVLLTDENDNIVSSLVVTTPVWGGVGNTWVNVATDSGSSFRKAIISFGGFGQPQLFADNISWNQVPSPGAMAMLGFSLIGCSRRRR